MSIFSWLGVQSSSKECRKLLDECQIDNLRNNRLEAAPWDLAAEPQEFYRKGGTENWRTELTPREAFLIEHLTRDLMAEFGFVAASRRKIIFPLIVASRLRYAVAWRLRARKSKREISERDYSGNCRPPECAQYGAGAGVVGRSVDLARAPVRLMPEAATWYRTSGSPQACPTRDALRCRSNPMGSRGARRFRRSGTSGLASTASHGPSNAMTADRALWMSARGNRNQLTE